MSPRKRGGRPPGLADVEFLNVFSGFYQIVKKHVAPDGDEFFPTGCAVLQQQISPRRPQVDQPTWVFVGSDASRQYPCQEVVLY
jgi:hypothetical protein